MAQRAPANDRPGTSELDWLLAAALVDLAALRERFMWLVAVLFTPFGRSGPRQGCQTTAFTLQAWCASTGWRGSPDRPPLSAGGRLGEYVGASVVTVGAALAARNASRGEDIDVYPPEVQDDCTDHLWLRSGELRKMGPVPGSGLHDPGTVGLSTNDGQVDSCAITALQFQDFLMLVERSDPLAEDSLTCAVKRARHFDGIAAVSQDWTRRRTTRDILKAVALSPISAAPTDNGQTVSDMAHSQEPCGLSADCSIVQPGVSYRMSGWRPLAPRPFPDVCVDTVRVGWTFWECLALTSRLHGPGTPTPCPCYRGGV